MTWSMIFFILVGAVSLAAAAGVVTSRQPVHAALSLLVNFAGLAVLYVTLDAQFLAAVQVIVYAGGIVILILFVIMLIGSDPVREEIARSSPAPYAAFGFGLLLLMAMIYTLSASFVGVEPNAADLAGGTPEVVGLELFTRYILPIELTAVLLLVALLGALLVARRAETPSQSENGRR